MKLKFNLESKDWLLFGILTFLWFNIVALIVLNLYQYANEGTFNGLNPLPIFTSTQLFSTIILWIGSEAAMVLSIKNKLSRKNRMMNHLDK